jgi:benzoylformate decarboxylase
MRFVRRERGAPRGQPEAAGNAGDAGGVGCSGDAGDVADAFVRELSRALPKDAIVFDEALTASGYVSKYFSKSVGGEFFQTRGGSLGVGIPGAMGIKLCAPGKTVVAFTGDGGSMYTMQALYTARRYDIGAKFVVCDNGGYQLLKDNLRHYWKDGKASPHGFPDCFSLGGIVDYVKLAESMGVSAARVDSLAGIDSAVRAMTRSDGPFLVELKTR